MKRSRKHTGKSILTLAPDAPLSLADVLKGVTVFGSVGCGKTSGSGGLAACSRTTGKAPQREGPEKEVRP